MGKVVVLGSFNVDLMARASRFPMAKETLMGSFFQMGPGGKGFNQCVAAHKAGCDVKMVAKVGKDAFCDTILDTMEELSMDSSYILEGDVGTGVALILVNEVSGENEIVVVAGANLTFNEDDFQKIRPLLDEAEYVLLQLEINQWMNEKVAEYCYEHGIKVIVNTAPYQPISDDFLSKVYMVTPNEVEAEQLSGIHIEDFESASKAAQYFKSKGVQHVIITLGSKGVFVSSNHQEEIIPAYKVKAIETTGAGDAFNGGLLAALSKGKDIWEAVSFANALAALSVQKLGTTPSMPPLEEIEAFLEEHR